MRQMANLERLKHSPMQLWRSLFRKRVVAPPPPEPCRCDALVLAHAEIAAMYTGPRVAGDFYQFLKVGPSRLLFVLLDAAGPRPDTREILTAVQKKFLTVGPVLFAGENFNEATAIVELCHEINRTILRSGLRSCPSFIGCYNEELGTVCYANAGHTPGLLRDQTGITPLGATGLPLGLFPHSTQSASACHLAPGAALVAASRGIVETNRLEMDSRVAEFGIAGVKQNLEDAIILSARELCLDVLQAAREFSPGAPKRDDLTTLALVRNTPHGAAWKHTQGHVLRT